VKLLVTIGIPLVYAVAVFWAMRSPPPKYSAQDSTAVTVKDDGGPAVLHSPDPIYPAAALRNRIEGTVTLRVEVNSHGEVADVETISGPKELVDAAIEAVRQWQFAATPMRTEIQVPFLLWHPGPRSYTNPEPVKRTPAENPGGLRGVVRVVALVGPGGQVEFVHPVSGPTRLRAAAVASVKQWLFRPAMRDGKPDRGTSVVDVTF
jgi:TonB family protein